MGLMSDLEEAKSLWKKSSLPMKAVGVFSVFMTISSIASLSDVIFQWKGFIRDGVQFYWRWISGPVAEFGNWIGLSYSQLDMDLLFLTALTLGSMTRIEIVRGRRFPKIILVALAAAWVGFGSMEYDGFPWWAALLIVLAYVVLYLKVGRMYERKLGRKAAIQYFLTGVVALVVILVLGAINAGLIAPLQ